MKAPHLPGLLDFYLDPVDSQRLRFKRTMMATVCAFGMIGLLLMMYLNSMLTSKSLAWSIGAVSTVIVVTHLLLATGINRRFADPSMTKLQTVSATLTMLFVAYQATPEGHGIAVLTIPIVFVFASFRFGFWSLLGLASLLMLLAIIETGFRFDFGADEAAGQGVVQLFSLAIALLTLCMVGGQFNDMRRRNRAQRAISHVAMTQLSEAVVTIDNEGRVRFMNKGARDLFGTHDSQESHPLIDHLCEFADQRPLSETLKYLATRVNNRRRAVSNAAAVSPEMIGGTIARANGEHRFIRLSISPLLQYSGQVDGFVLVVRDVSDAQRLMKELEHAATHDVLTGLLNRRGFINALQVTLGGPQSPGLRTSVIAIDLDQFKMVNDACGHDAGDDLLRNVASMMRNIIPETAQLARLGGDEFGIILTNTSLQQTQSISDLLIQEFRALRFVRQGRSFKVGASLGIAQQTDDLREAQSLLSRADSACYLAKQKGRNCVQVYTLGDVEVSRHQRDMSWATRINEALEQHRFVLFAQRISPSQVREASHPHFEVLIRMVNPDGSIVQPGTFMPAAERFDLVSAIDREVIRLAMSALSVMMKRQKIVPTLSVNLSPSSLRDPALLTYIGQSLEQFALPGNQLVFELTESAAIFDLGQAQSFFRGLKALGCRVALDDVGSGFNSFDNLRQLPVDQIKIDGSYVRGACENELDFAFVQSIQRIAEILQVKTVAEFVEDERTRLAMVDIGVNYLQGYGLHSPEPLLGLSVSQMSSPSIA
ncbi:MAG: EAL domain-containing protein [Burkholderiaceae bacterium]